MKRADYFNFIEQNLNFLAFRTLERGRLNLLEIHLHSENFYRDLLNLIFGWRLRNLNAVDQNTEGIDLVCDANSVVVQVSATATKHKIESALAKDLAGYSSYTFKFMSICRSAKNLTSADKQYSNPHGLPFDHTKDIHDTTSVLGAINNLDIERLRAVYDYIALNLGDPSSPGIGQSISLTNLVSPNIGGDLVVGNVTHIHTPVVNGHAEIEIAVGFLSKGDAASAKAHLLMLRTRSWDQLSPRERYRTIANLGNCEETLGNKSAAGSLFVEAYAFQPKEERPWFLKVHGLGLLGENELAGKEARDLKDTFPLSREAWSAWIRFCGGNATDIEIEALIPKEVQRTDDLALVLSERAAQRGDFEKSLQYLATLEISHPGTFPVGRARVVALINRTAARIESNGNEAISGEEEAKLRQAIAIIDQLLSTETGKSTSGAADLHELRSAAFHLLRDDQQALADAREACRLLPNSEEAVFRMALVHAEKGQLEEALALLKKCAATSWQAKTLALDIATKVTSAKHLPYAKSIVDETIVKSLDAHMAFPMCDFAARVYARMNRANEGDTLISAVASRGEITSDELLLLRLHLYAMSDDIDKANSIADEIRAALPSYSDRNIRVLVSALHKLQRWSDIVLFSRDLVFRDERSEVIDLFLESCSQSGEIKSALEFLKMRRSNGFYVSRHVAYELEMLDSLGAHEEMISVCRSAIGSTKVGKEARFYRAQLSIIGAKTERPELIEKDPALLPSASEAGASNAPTISMILSKGPDPLSSIRFSYEIIRRNFDSSQAYKAVVISFRMPTGSVDIGPTPTVVAPGCAVAYSIDDADAVEWIILEDDIAIPPSLSRAEHGPESPLAVLFKGKNKGDVCVTDYGRRFTIKGISTKYHYRLGYVLENYERHFNDFFIRGFNAIKRDGTPNFEELLRQTMSKSESSSNILQQYKDGGMTIGLLAERLNVSFFEVMATLSDPATESHIFSAVGSNEESALEHRLLSGCQAVVIDLTAVVTLQQLDRADTLLSLIPAKIFIAEGTLISVKNTISELKSMRDLRSGAIGYKAGSLRFTERDPQALDRIITRLDVLLDVLTQRCEVKSGLNLANTAPKKRDLIIKYVGQAGAESIGIAQECNAMLWSDDYFARVAAKHEMNINGVWTQSVVTWLQISKLIPSDLANQVHIDLNALRYTFTRITTDAVVEALRKYAWNFDSEPVSSALNSLVDERMDARRVGFLLSGFFPAVWKSVAIRVTAEAVTLKVFRLLQKRYDSEIILGVLLRLANKIFGLDVVSEELFKQLIVTSKATALSRSTRIIRF